MGPPRGQGTTARRALVVTAKCGYSLLAARGCGGAGGSTVTIVEDLRTLPLFHGISETRLSQLVSVLHPYSHPAGTVLFRPGDTATHFEILTRGQVTLEEA